MSSKNIKDDFLDSWNEMLPDGVLNVATKPIPTAPTVAMPETVEDSVIVQGKLAKYLLDFFNTYDGFTPVDLILHIGQRNNVNKAMLAASLELAKEDAEKHEIAIDEPAGDTYTTDDSPLTCRVEVFGDLSELEEVWVSVVFPDESTAEAGLHPVEGSDRHFETEIGIMQTGTYTLQFHATVAGYTFSSQVLTFTVSEGEGEPEPEPEPEP